MAVEDVSVAVDQRHDRGVDAQQPARQAGDPMEGFAVVAVQQSGALQHREPRRFIG
jgi:hypothetical protein